MVASIQVFGLHQAWVATHMLSITSGWKDGVMSAMILVF
jgi:hypothetical protein